MVIQKKQRASVDLIVLENKQIETQKDSFSEFLRAIIDQALIEKSITPEQFIVNFIKLMQAGAPEEPEELIRIQEVLRYAPISIPSIYRKMREGSFPKNVECGVNARAWKKSDILQWQKDPSNYGSKEKK